MVNTLKLKLFSGEDMSQEFCDDLNLLLKLDATRLDALIQARLKIAKLEDTDREKIAVDVGVSEKELRRLMSVTNLVFSRILGGKSNADIQDDLVSHGFPKEKVKTLFSALENLSASAKNDIRYSCLILELARIRTMPRLSSIGGEANLTPVVDVNSVVGIIPQVHLRMTVATGQKEDKLTLELDEHELTTFIKTLETLKKELQVVLEDLKKRLGDLLVIRTASD